MRFFSNSWNSVAFCWRAIVLDFSIPLHSEEKERNILRSVNHVGIKQQEFLSQSPTSKQSNEISERNRVKNKMQNMQKVFTG